MAMMSVSLVGILYNFRDEIDIALEYNFTEPYKNRRIPPISKKI